MADEIFGLSAEGIRRTAKANEITLGRLPDVGRRTRRVPLSDGAEIIFGRATSAISAASSPLAPTAFTFKEFLTDDATATPHTQKEATSDTAGVNEWPDGYSVDTLVCMSFTKGEWHLVNAREVCPSV